MPMASRAESIDSHRFAAKDSETRFHRNRIMVPYPYNRTQATSERPNTRTRVRRSAQPRFTPLPPFQPSRTSDGDRRRTFLSIIHSFDDISRNTSSRDIG